jgi:uncharacterized protein YunC (DUF1805 family)
VRNFTPAAAGFAADLVLADSITDLGMQRNVSAVVASGSHGGAYAAHYAWQAGMAAVVFNDAGVGKDRAGVAGLDILADAGIPAGAVSCQDARIGIAADTLAASLAHVNAPALAAGWQVGQAAREALKLSQTVMPEHPITADAPPLTEAATRVAMFGAQISILDSISLVAGGRSDAIVISGSHGGLPGGNRQRALKTPVRAAVFNDASGGREGAGWTRLAALDEQRVAAATVSALTARIGSGMSSLEDGILSHVNMAASEIGARPGMTTVEFVSLIAKGSVLRP